MRKIWEKCKKISLREWGKEGLLPGGSVLWGGVGGICAMGGVRKKCAKGIGVFRGLKSLYARTMPKISLRG